jgi:hypothetical protein
LRCTPTRAGGEPAELGASGAGEQERIGERVGCQDQYICALGLRMLEFRPTAVSGRASRSASGRGAGTLAPPLHRHQPPRPRDPGRADRADPRGAVQELGALAGYAGGGGACHDGDLRLASCSIRWMLKRTSSRITSGPHDRL